MKIIILQSAIFFSFYILGAYATTDILRLLKGCRTPVSAPDCYCPVCGRKIALRDQIPVFSYIKNNGTCKNCKSPIPPSDLILEVFLFLLPSVTAGVLRFSRFSLLLCIIIYEGTKLFFLLRFGKRKEAFGKNLLFSLSANLLLFSFIAFLFALERMAAGYASTLI